jgi:pimeloyl-ACP methyl ester carboxylesterase
VRAGISQLTLPLLATVLLAGCGGSDEKGAASTAPQTTTSAPASPDPRPAPKGEKVHFKATDGKQVGGAVLRSAGKGAPALVLVHSLNGGAAEWDSFQAELHDAGFTTLTYEGRGGLDEAELLKEVQGAVRFLRAHGSRRMGVVGASIGATTALLASTTLGPGKLGAVVALSPVDSPTTFDLQDKGTYHPHGALMLSDQREKPSVDNLYDGAERSRRAVAPISGHGTELLTDERVRRKVVDWLKARLG